LAVAAILVEPQPAAAEPETRVVVLTEDAHSTTCLRLVAELQTVGFAVDTLQSEGHGRSSLERAARERDAVAAVRVVPVANAVEVWVVDQVTGKTLIREVVAGEGGSSTSDEMIAVGAVELLRASILEVHVEATTKPKRETPPAYRKIAPGPKALAPRPRSPWLSASLETTGTFALSEPEIGAQIAVWSRVWRGFGVRAHGSVPLRSSRLDARGSQALISSKVVGLQGVGTWTWAPQWVTQAGAGLFAVRLDTEGRAQPPRVGVEDGAWLFGPSLHAGGGWSPAASVRLRVDATALWTARAASIRFSGEEVDRWGRPVVIVGAGLELMWPGSL